MTYYQILQDEEDGMARTITLAERLADFESRHGHLVYTALAVLAAEQAATAEKVEADGDEFGLAAVFRESAARYDEALDAWANLSEALEEALE